MNENLVISTGYNDGNYYIDPETGYVNGSASWVFKGLSHVKRNEFIPLHMITSGLLATMKDSGELFYKNGKCQYTVRDTDHGTTREWGNRPMFIWFEAV